MILNVYISEVKNVEIHLCFLITEHDTTDQNIFQSNKITYAMSLTKNDS